MSWRARLSTTLNEIRVVYCAHSASSAGTRAFIKHNYPDLKALNPGLPIYIRPSDGADPHIAARYARGVYEVRSTADMSTEQVLAELQALEAVAPQINARVGTGIGGDTFRLADII